VTAVPGTNSWLFIFCMQYVYKYLPRSLSSEEISSRLPKLAEWTCTPSFLEDAGAETSRSLIFVMNCILLSAYVGCCINCKNMHGLST
jgi:hypothetical protein